jgi:hypothetical protein
LIRLDRRNALTLIAGLCVAPQVLATPDQRAALSADAVLLRRIYETLHPGLYRYQTAQQFAKRCTELEERLAGNLTLGQQYLVLSRLLAQIRCGHTYANFFNQTDAVAGVLVAPANKLPFLFAWRGERMTITGNPLQVDGISAGDEVLSINSAAVAEIQATLLPLIRADGSNDAKRRALLEVTGAERIASFDVYFPLAYPNRTDRFSLETSSPAGNRRSLTLSAISQEQRSAMASAGPSITSPDYWSLDWPIPTVVRLNMPSWAMYNVKWDWKKRIGVIFEEIVSRGAKGLVIDLRSNEGGNDCGYEIIAHLIDSDLTLPADYERRVRFRSSPADLKPYLDTWDRSFEHLGAGATDIGGGFYRLQADADQPTHVAPQEPCFKGKVIVLSSPQNSSATFQFIALMRRAGLARIYGQPTGGNQRGINGGSFFFVRLPNTGLEADLPLVGVFPVERKPDAGLAPDVTLEQSQMDIAIGRDSVLERAIRDVA